MKMDLSKILMTKNADGAILRARKMGLTPRCGRCGGSGSYSWNAMDGSRCFGCGGIGYVAPKTKKEWELTEEAAIEAANDGTLDAYRQELFASIRAENALKSALNTWKNINITEMLPSHLRSDHELSERELFVRQQNKRISDAYNELDKVFYNRKKGEYQNVVDVLDNVLEVIADVAVKIKE